MSEAPKQKPVMTLEYSDEYVKGRIEIYMLQANQHFAGFGGSRSGLVTGKTPSMITRHVSVGVSDVERDIDDQFVWDMIKRAINGGWPCKAK